jgi:hypothetical protein
MKKGFIALLFCFLFSWSLFSQSNQTFLEFENQMRDYMDLMYDAPTDNERFNANEKLMLIFEEVLSMEKSFAYPFEQLSRISNLKSSDNFFRIFTWAIVSQDGSFESFGFVQAKNAQTDEYEVYKLTDKSDEIFNPELAKCDNNTWFGAVYYELITTKYDDRTFYTLLGFDANNIYTKRRVIEPISFKSRSGKPEFGASYFYKDRDRRRYVFEYNAEARFVLKWDNQYYEDKSKKNKSSSKNSLFKKRQRQTTPAVIPVVQEQMIVYEVLKPMYESVEGMEGMSQFYVPSEQINGFKFERGRWRFIERVLARNSDKEKKYKPAQKKTVPLYNSQ